MSGTWTVLRWELFKITRQAKAQLVLAACLLGPFLFVAALNAQGNVPQDTLFGRWVHDSGFAVPLVVLGFAGQWALPAVTAVVAGDMFAAEDRYGTWKTILTRSRGRTQVFAGKALAATAFSVAATVVLALASLAAGVLLVGRQPMVGLSGTLLPAGRCTALVLASWASVLPPVLAFTALGLLLSAAGRSGALGIGGPVVLGLVLQLVSLVNAPVLVRTLLPTTPFGAWHGLFADPPFYGPLQQGTLVSVLYLAVCAGAAYALLRRRDITGG
ncbi:ABC-2 family transporter protein [Actinomadura rubteroloni]|uniref:ABC-2 family transporter protein n=1 Tax=Actinomadura rubteroloni TaxID=1926885 RepID=A0A2P4UF57_9ACTN|nr:ABC transporter permease [Actinomadura rubteroloni]POM23666.1 ABC-2 family transporter protein [Actinomadura rubteroloni]